MLSKDRATLRNVVLTATVAMSGALIVGTVWLGGHKNVPRVTTTVTSADDARLSAVGGPAAPLTAGTTTITSNTYNVTNDNRVEGSSASGAPTDTVRGSAPRPRACRRRRRRLLRSLRPRRARRRPSPPRRRRRRGSGRASRRAPRLLPRRPADPRTPAC